MSDHLDSRVIFQSVMATPSAGQPEVWSKTWELTGSGKYFFGLGKGEKRRWVSLENSGPGIVKTA